MAIGLHRVFVSHSGHATEEPATLAFLDQLLRALAPSQGFDPQVDQRELRGGDDWLQRIYAWIGLCEAAVILLSPRAVTRENSTWVPREANLLMWRHALDARFVVVPVALGGVTLDDIKANPFLADLRLEHLQFAGGADDAARAAQVAGVLRERLQAARPRSAFDPVQVNVEDSLQRYAPPPSVQAALALLDAEARWRPYVEPHQNLSLQLLRHAVKAEEVDPAIRSVAQGSQAEFGLARLLYDALYPMRLPAGPACTLHALCLQQAGRGAVLVNCRDSWALRVLLRAATGLPAGDFGRRWRLVELPEGWGDDDEAEIVAELQRVLADTVWGTGGQELLADEPDPDAALGEALDEVYRQTGSPTLVCARYAPRWAELAGTLAGRFAHTALVLWTGDALPALPALPQGACVALDPPLPPGEDRRWQRQYRATLTTMEGSRP